MILVYRGAANRRAGSVSPKLANRVLKIAGVTVALFLVGAWAGELLWALLAASLVLGLGDKA